MSKRTNDACTNGYGSETGSDSANRKRSVRWDEANLEVNEKIKSDLNPVRINEPKTPYRGPMDADEEEELDDASMSPLILDVEAELTPFHSSRPTESGSRHSEGEMVSGNEDSHEWDGISSGRASSEGEGSVESRAEKRRRFEQHRKQHYNMRQALRMGKELASEELSNGELSNGEAKLNGNNHLSSDNGHVATS
eukprot:jgi/Botrbrau1/15314/Bobra.0319s0004.1